MSIPEALTEHSIRLKDYGHGDHKALCPRCSSQRRNKSDPCLSVTIGDDGAVWFCHHCEWTDGVRLGGSRAFHAQPKPQPVRITQQPGALTDECLAYFAQRKIAAEALAAAGVGWSASRSAVVFPYRKPGSDVIVNCKFRRLPKDGFSQIKGGEKIYWLLNRLNPEISKTLFIVEGEMDALSLLDAGVPNVISVPDGAPKTAGQGGEHSKKFSFVGACEEWTSPFERIVIATDADEPGYALAEELARRYGKDRCWRIEWPEGIKDANEYLVQHGHAALNAYCQNPTPWPIDGLFTVRDFAAEVMSLFTDGRQRGISTGFPSVDQIYTVAPGQLTVVTGIPNNGKSEFIDQLMVNLARSMGWVHAICSFENDPAGHISKLAEKWLRLPFWDGPTMRMTSWNLEKALGLLNEHFHFMRCEGEQAPTLDWILEKARVLVMRFGIRGLVIDPYNEIEHQRPSNMTETEYVSHMLARLKRFASVHGVHVWFVAHPAKMKPEGGKTPVPTLYEISGSANFVNKADCGIVVHRGDERDTTEIWVRKVRFKWVGQQGKATLDYDRVTGVYSDRGQVQVS